MKPWLGGVSSVRSVLVCSLELPLGSLALFELDRWDRVSLSSEGALSSVLVACSWELESESWLCLAVWLTGLVALSWSTGALCLVGMCWRRAAESRLISVELAVIPEQCAECRGRRDE